jgi:hypothetical protein
MEDKIRKAIQIHDDTWRKARKLGEEAKKIYEPVIKAARETAMLFRDYLAKVLIEQEEVRDKWIEQGYAYFSNYHIVTLVLDIQDEEERSDSFADNLFEIDIIDLIIDEYEEIEKVEYVTSVLKTLDKDNLTHSVPLLTLLVERLMRILTDKLESNIQQAEIKKMISRSIVKYKTEEMQELTEEDLEDFSKLKEKIDANVKELYIDTYKKIVEEDFMKDDRYAKGAILNRHALLHGKQDLDEINKKDAIKLLFLVHYFIDLIKLKDTGELVIQ